ncbi:MAG: bifunctional diaminohydroxyphosphoribosylaminopyrimidine deaminase/5-amino-6-(5-phosphoribosylamino)uracil reductase RibD [Chitinispirillaceae bacterium]|nr:bifunctional diaminohydroxyphosphoribosylaminopyrimidine deaminase/5-amino-6-(5-phosphoribosylamino)uracil reductase RibD [Chitinispirillaceae bacterium]
MPVVNSNSAADQAFMDRALSLAEAVKGKTFPNPAVGAVVVAKGTVVGQGATRRAGGPHAEIVALGKAGRAARGATLYVTLEPCCHLGRTPPCTDAIIRAGIRRAVVAVGDPNPLVRGRGTARLRAAGIRVDVGLLAGRAAALNEDFFWAITRQRAWITLKLALTLDGRIADTRGKSQWITGKEALRFAQELRRRHAAVAVGRRTLERDDPRLSVRHKKGFSPARIVFASRKHALTDSFFARHAAEARSIVVMPGGRAPAVVREPSGGVECWRTGETGGCEHLLAFTRMAYENDITSVLVEGGSALASAFMEHGLVNRVYLLYGNKLFGNGLAGFNFDKGLQVESAMRLGSHEVLLLGDTVGITGIPSR